MTPMFDLLDPDDYLYIDAYDNIRKTFPSLTWDDVIRKGLEEWMLLARKDEEIQNLMEVQE